MKIETLQIFDTEYSADTIEWCNHDDYAQYFACGTYQVTENANTETNGTQRKGRIYLMKFDIKTEELVEVQRIETAAILDMKWLPKNIQTATLAAATALGEVLFYQLASHELKLVCTLKLDASRSDILALSLDISPNEASNCCSLLISDSTGGVNLWQYDADGPRIGKDYVWSAHNFEAWICCFDKWHEDKRIYTGGDDCLLHAYGMNTRERLWTNKCHEAGVTCLLSHGQNEYQLLTGSYDEHVRLFDTRHMKNPLHALNLHGGIWRLKSHPKQPNLLLVACMYENFSLVELNASNANALELKGIYKEHGSICYGADWSVDNNQNSLYMATCSFYDHKLCISKIIQNEC